MLTQLPSGVRECLASAVHHPDGPSHLWSAELESAAALYQVPPHRLEAVREHFPHEATRHAVLEVARSTLGPTPRPEARATPPDALTLLSLAAQQPEGLSYLTKAPLETAAILFGVHVFVVEEARRLLAEGTLT
jgi:hypothetical protein